MKLAIALLVLCLLLAAPGALDAQQANFGSVINPATVDGIQIVDGNFNTSITVAINRLGSNPGMVIVPSTWSTTDTYNNCGTNVTVLDLRANQTTVNGNCALSINVTPNQAGVSHSFVRAAQFWTNPTTSSAAVIAFATYGGTFAGANTQSEEAINGTTLISGTPTNIPGSLFIVGGEFASQFQTSGAGVTFPDVRGSTHSVSLLSGNTSSITSASAVRGQVCTVAGTGTIANCFSIYGELPTAATSLNFAGFFEGDTRFGGTPGTSRIALDVGQSGAIFIKGSTSDASLGAGAAGSVFYRSDLLRFRAWDGANWHSLLQTDAATSQKAETTTPDANVLTLTPPAQAGTYRVCAVISVSAATTGVISWTLSWTDSNGNAQSNIAQQIFQMGTAAPNTTFTTSAAGNYYGCSMIDINNAGTAIVVKWVGGGTTTAKMSATIERLQ